MQHPALPSNEGLRLDSLRRLFVLDTPAEERFDRITRLAQSAFDVPIALISLVDEERQWFKSKQGLSIPETPRKVSFCGHAILRDEFMIIEDALGDPRFRDNPLVTGAPGVHFYAGAPLRDDASRALGTLCLIDSRPRRLEDNVGAFGLEMFEALRRLCEAELSLPPLDLADYGLLEEFSDRGQLIDGATGCWNRTGFLEIARRSLDQAARLGVPLSLIAGRFVDYRQDTDERSALAAQRLRSVERGRSMVHIARFGGWLFRLGVGEGQAATRRILGKLHALAADAPDRVPTDRVPTDRVPTDRVRADRAPLEFGFESLPSGGADLAPLEWIQRAKSNLTPPRNGS